MHRARTASAVLAVGLSPLLIIGAAFVLYQLLLKPQEIAEISPRDWS